MSDAKTLDATIRARGIEKGRGAAQDLCQAFASGMSETALKAPIGNAGAATVEDLIMTIREALEEVMGAEAGQAEVDDFVSQVDDLAATNAGIGAAIKGPLG